MASREIREGVARDARSAAKSGDLAAARTAWRRLVRLEPDNPVWRLRLGDVSADGVVAHSDVVVDALAADAPLAALTAALAAGTGGLGLRFERYLQGSGRLGRGAPPQPPLPLPETVPPDLDAPLPRWPSRHTTGPVTPMPLLSSLDVEAFNALVPALSRRSLAPGEVLLAEGAVAEALFLVAGGELEVIKADEARGEVTLGSLRAGSVVGEMALVLDRPRTATVRAVRDAELIRVDLQPLRALAEARPAVRDALATFTRERVLATLIGTSPLFADLDQAARGAVLWRFTHRDALPDEVVLSEGEAPSGLFLVVEGGVQVLRDDALVAHLGPGDVFGEIALVQGGTTTATVVANTDTHLLLLARRDFEALCTEFPAVRTRAVALGAARLAENRFIFEDDEFIEAAD